jgi:3,4-dihydroxy 2-butanone 4-phosphate synthase / GTP cyclohydrolase II
MNNNGKAATTRQLMKAVSTRLPTEYGAFTVHAYVEPSTQATHLALVCGDVSKASSPLVRIHSECMTGDLFGSVRCDCGQQLTHAMQAMQHDGAGILIYLRQEGRGIGLINKLRAYNLQDTGLDTVEANLELGFKADHRDYKAAVAILEDLQVHRIRLLTNNPDKLAGFEGSQVRVVERIPLQVKPNDENVHYMRTKRDRLGHLLDIQSWTT